MTYLSASHPRWEPRTEDDLRQAADGGLLEETHYLELKRELASGPSSNKELARDLSSLAIDGGTLIIGVDEKTTPPMLYPVPLRQLPERIEQIARTTPDPPLPVITRTITSTADPDKGYVLVTVPISGLAPHMVDNVYFGRGDKTKTRLSDAEVLRHHRARKDTEETITGLLAEYVRRDPVPAGEQKHAHLFIVAAPVAPRREMLLEVVDGPDWAVFRKFINAGYQPSALMRRSFSPDLHLAGSTAHRPDGIALTSGLTQDRHLYPARADSSGETGALEIELTEDGTLRVFTGRLSDELSGVECLLIHTVPVLVRRVVHIAGAISEHAGYLGPWMFGVAATRIGGLTATSSEMSIRSDRPLPRDTTEYRQVTTASAAELQQTPGAVTGRLVNRLLRAVDRSGSYDDFTTDPSPTA